MGIVISNTGDIDKSPNKPGQITAIKTRSLLLCWEIYPILALAAFFRLFGIEHSLYANDDALLFNLARHFFTYGLFPITGNQASVGNLNPPFAIYLFMLPAAISSNPVSAQIMVALFNIVAVLLVYIFVKRYYGRTAASIAALLFAVAAKAILYSRNIWQPDMMPFFTMFFFLALFRGIIERRHGWLVPATALLAILYQLHSSSMILLLPLAMTILFAWRTIRWQDLLFSILMVIVLFAPYLYLQYLTHGADVKILVAFLQANPHIDTQGIDTYLNFLRPFTQSLDLNIHNPELASYPGSIFSDGIFRRASVHLYLYAIFVFMVILLYASIMAAVLFVITPGKQITNTGSNSSFFKVLGYWWLDLYKSPQRQGVLLLIVWQTSVLSLLRHSIILYPHYLLTFLPGQFILIGIFLGKLVQLAKHYRPDFAILARVGTYTLVALVVGAQLIGSSGALFDELSGHINARQYVQSYHDAISLQNVLIRADALAQQRHIQRIYVSANEATIYPYRLFAEDRKTPINVFENWFSTVLPDPKAGPVIFVDDTENPIVEQILKQYTSAQLLEQVPQLSNPPLNIYLVTTKSETTTVTGTYSSDLQLLEPQARAIINPGTDTAWLTTHWKIKQTSTKPAPFKDYYFALDEQTNTGFGQIVVDGQSFIWSGDEIVMYPRDTLALNQWPTSLTVQASTFLSVPANYKLGALTLTTLALPISELKQLKTENGDTSVTLPVVK